MKWINLHVARASLFHISTAQWKEKLANWLRGTKIYYSGEQNESDHAKYNKLVIRLNMPTNILKWKGENADDELAILLHQGATTHVAKVPWNSEIMQLVLCSQLSAVKLYKQFLFYMQNPTHLLLDSV